MYNQNIIKDLFNISGPITKEWLRAHPDCVFVFGDNLLRKGKGGAAALRDETNTYGFVTKRYPSNEDDSFYKPEDYGFVLDTEMFKLKLIIENDTNKYFLISKLGGGLANKYNIRPLIEKRMQELRVYPNVVFLD